MSVQPLYLKEGNEKSASPLQKEEQPKKLFSRGVDASFSFSQAVKNEEPSGQARDKAQQSTMSYAGAVKKTPLAAESKQAAGVADEQQNDLYQQQWTLH